MVAGQPSAEPRGRVLGSPPPKPGMEFKTRAQELLQQHGQAPARPNGGDGFEPFSPGLPIKPAYPTGSGRPVEPPAAVDYDSGGLPPEAPPAESRITQAMLLRRREKK